MIQVPNVGLHWHYHQWVRNEPINILGSALAGDSALARGSTRPRTKGLWLQQQVRAWVSCTNDQWKYLLIPHRIPLVQKVYGRNVYSNHPSSSVASYFTLYIIIPPPHCHTVAAMCAIYKIHWPLAEMTLTAPAINSHREGQGHMYIINCSPGSHGL